ncbi:MAG TPA: asparagine synthase (glutamine-hydrolyzing) [Flavobacteriales bacterium]|nr:asparagine synthase (glutamine-hydrolyzing) [Flavobacteriales bacterium]
MCGIVGIFNLNEETIKKEVIEAMAEAIAHRGPDGEGSFVENNIALAHRRLAIIDPSPRSSQPMISGDGNWVIVFNGCIYNFKELKKELEAAGHKFRTTSDTEVICEGLSKHGPQFFEQLDGMFAVGAWNVKEKTLYLSRDRFGVKPLYYWLEGKRVVFSSEIKAIIKHPDFKTELNPEALNEYFTFQNLFRYHTLFKGVTMLPPANTVKINAESTFARHVSWWDYDFTQPDDSMTFEEATAGTKELMEKAVKKQLVSDVPVGSFLSGGMDSGSITSIASSNINRLSTFTAGFDMSGVTGVEANYDERRDAELMANYFNTEHYEQVINAGDLSWSLPRVVWHIEDLRVGMSYPNYYISRLASKFVKVCLQGTGGDELYGGYPWRYYRVFNSLDQNEFFKNYYDFWQRLVPLEQRQNMFTSSISKEMELDSPREVFERVFTFNSKLRYNTPEEHIQNSLYFEIKTFLPGLLLVGDKLSMANGLEERFPFLDNELVDFAQKIPIKHKLGDIEHMKGMDENIAGDKKVNYQEFSSGKTVLRKAMEGFLPMDVLKRKKQGFSAPDESWYRGENADYVSELLLNKKALYPEFIDKAYVKQILNEHMNKKVNHRLLIWSFMNFEWWCRLFLDGQDVNQST